MTANVISLENRKLLLSQLKGSVAVLNAEEKKASYAASIREMEIRRGKNLITDGISILSKQENPEAAIEFIRNTLRAIQGG